MKEARHNRSHIVWFHLYKISKIVKSIEMESKLLVARSLEDEGGYLLMRSGFLFGLIKWKCRTSLVVQWLRIRLPMQATRVWALVWEDPTCRGATKPMHRNYWAFTLEPTSHNYGAHASQLLKPARSKGLHAATTEPTCHNFWAHVLQLLKPTHLEPVLHSKRSHCNEKPVQHNEEQRPLTSTRESPCTATKTQHSQ